MSAPLPLASVNHIARETTDVDKSIAFYRDVLGFRQIWRPNFSFRGAWLYNYGMQIHLIEGRPPERDAEIRTRADHLAFHTEMIDEVERRLQELRIPYHSNLTPQGVKQLFFHDPDGNHIEVGAYPPIREMDKA